MAEQLEQASYLAIESSFDDGQQVFDVTPDYIKSYYLYFLNPYNMLRLSSLMAWDWVLEKKAAWSQRLRNEEPRINRGGIYFILRSLMTIFLRILAYLP